MWTIIGGTLLTWALSLIGGRIALYKAKLWYAENKHKVKWEIIYTIFGPDPNNPLPVVPPTPEPRRPWLPWRRKDVPQQQVVLVPQLPLSKAEQWVGSLEFAACWMATSFPVSYLIWTFAG